MRYKISQRRVRVRENAWLTAGVYEVIGRNMFAIQLINASLGASTLLSFIGPLNTF